jgi:ribosomal protein S18 acetylase RimI-like enzyme
VTATDVLELVLQGRIMNTRRDANWDGAVHKLLGISLDDGAPAYRLIGNIEWDADTGEVMHLWVVPEYQRRGVATELWRQAQAQGARHSAWRTKDGQVWALSTGDTLPAWKLA